MGVEISDIIRDNIHKLNLNYHENNVLTHLMDCRTAKLGGHTLSCSNPKCDHKEMSYNSCRDRNCPKCQGSKQIKWVSSRIDELLPVNYFHVVFTVPSPLKKIFEYNKAECYKILFKSVNSALVEISSNKKNLGKIGFTAVLHTWTQKVNYYPHIHCVIPEGGMNKDKNKWIKYSNTMLNKENLGIIFKRHLMKNINNAYRLRLINYPEILSDSILEKIKKGRHNVYVKKTFGDAAGLINYLGNYSNKIAITNNRIKSYEDGVVTFTWMDRADGNKIKDIKIDAVVFLKRFVFHILPYKLTKIRYFGYLANACRKVNIKLCLQLIEKLGEKLIKLDTKVRDKANSLVLRLTKPMICPICHKGYLLSDLERYQNGTFNKIVGVF